MALTFPADGSQASTASEADLFTTVTVDGYHGLILNTSNMASGDTVDIIIYIREENSSTLRKVDTVTISDAQTNPHFYLPMYACKAFRVAIQRTAGTDRTYHWTRVLES